MLGSTATCRPPVTRQDKGAEVREEGHLPSWVGCLCPSPTPPQRLISRPQQCSPPLCWTPPPLLDPIQPSPSTSLARKNMPRRRGLAKSPPPPCWFNMPFYYTTGYIQPTYDRFEDWSSFEVIGSKLHICRIFDAYFKYIILPVAGWGIIVGVIHEVDTINSRGEGISQRNI